MTKPLSTRPGGGGGVREYGTRSQTTVLPYPHLTRALPNLPSSSQREAAEPRHRESVPDLRVSLRDPRAGPGEAFAGCSIRTDHARTGATAPVARQGGADGLIAAQLNETEQMAVGSAPGLTRRSPVAGLTWTLS